MIIAVNVKWKKITAQLYDLVVTERKDDFSARIVKRESRVVEDLAPLVMARSTDLNFNTLINVYNFLKDGATEVLLNSSNVKFGNWGNN